MAKSAEPATSQDNSLDRPLDNAGVARCLRAWHRAYNKELADIDAGESDYPARKAGNQAYLRALPPLAGRDNIRNFIACVAQASIMDVLLRQDVAQLLYAAQVATGAAGREPNPPKSPAAGTTPSPLYLPGVSKMRFQQAKSFRISIGSPQNAQNRGVKRCQVVKKRPFLSDILGSRSSLRGADNRLGNLIGSQLVDMERDMRHAVERQSPLVAGGKVRPVGQNGPQKLRASAALERRLELDLKMNRQRFGHGQE
jgi:hypothetical protein